MDEQGWSDVDDYIVDWLLPLDPALSDSLAASATAGLPAIGVPAPQGKLLMLLAQTLGARRVLEVGTLGGYSTTWLARGLVSDGQVVTIEVSPAHADVARANLVRCGVADRVTVMVGRALDVLPNLVDSGQFDLSFLDADKVNNPAYFDWAVRLSRPGALVVVDNVVRGGALLDESSGDANVAGVRRLFEQVAADPRVDATAIQTVGRKGYDGFLLARVL